MLVLMMEVGPVVVRVLAGLMAMRVAVLAQERRFMAMIVMPVVVAMSVLVLHRPVAMKMAMPLGDVQMDARRKEQPGDHGRPGHPALADRPRDHDSDEGTNREDGASPSGTKASLGQEVEPKTQPVPDRAAREERERPRKSRQRLPE